MIIVNKDHTEAYNISHITNMYIGSDGCSIKVAAGSATRGGILGKYNSYEETKKAFGLLLESIAKKAAGVLYMPDDEEVNQRIKLEPHQTYRHVAGKKTKGYGGS